MSLPSTATTVALGRAKGSGTGVAGVAEAGAASAGSAPRLSTDGCLEMRDCSPKDVRPGPRGTGGGGLKKLVMEPQPSACASAGVHALSGGGIGGHAGAAPSGSCDDDSSSTALTELSRTAVHGCNSLNLVRSAGTGSEPADQFLSLRRIFRAIARGLRPTTA